MSRGGAELEEHPADISKGEGIDSQGHYLRMVYEQLSFHRQCLGILLGGPDSGLDSFDTGFQTKAGARGKPCARATVAQE
jgi:hypothetical protein